MNSALAVIDKIALALVIIGAVNWGLVGVFRFDLVAWLFGGRCAQPHCLYSRRHQRRVELLAFVQARPRPRSRTGMTKSLPDGGLVGLLKSFVF